MASVINRFELSCLFFSVWGFDEYKCEGRVYLIERVRCRRTTLFFFSKATLETFLPDRVIDIFMGFPEQTYDLEQN